jgi:hypothetical protein
MVPARLTPAEVSEGSPITNVRIYVARALTECTERNASSRGGARDRRRQRRRDPDPGLASIA